MLFSKSSDWMSQFHTRAKIKLKKMEKNEIKKALYKQNPIAKLDYIRKGNAYYYTYVNKHFDDGTFESHDVRFEIPINDMGDADFGAEMESKLLQRWIM